MAFTARQCRYFSKTLIEMVLEKSSISCVCFSALFILTDCNGNQNAKNETNIVIKIISLDTICFTDFFFFLKISSFVSLQWQLRVSIDL